ncbi:MAG: hypothetical protein ACR2LM_05400 [Pyrinomonadaceae bacterium]
MYCPKCSQQQASEELRFCSRCGFPLAGVATLMANDGALPRVEHTAPSPARRGRIIKESALLTLVAWVVAFFTTMFWDWGGPLESVTKAGSLIFFLLGLIGLLRFLYAFLFVREASFATPEPAFPHASSRAALPPQQHNPLTDYPRRTNTREMAPRPSVTENTTRLLEEQPQNVDE